MNHNIYTSERVATSFPRSSPTRPKERDQDGAGVGASRRWPFERGRACRRSGEGTALEKSKLGWKNLI